MRILLTTLIIFPFLLFSQNNKIYEYSPKWKVGDKKEITLNTTYKLWDKEKLAIDETDSIKYGSVEVTDKTKEAYTLHIRIKNIAFGIIEEIYKNIDLRLLEYEYMLLIYEFNKIDGSYSLRNWKDIQGFMNESFSGIDSILKSEDQSLYFRSQLLLMPEKSLMNDKSAFENKMQEQIGYLFTPYGKKFTLNTAIVTESQEKNVFPFNNTSEINVITKLSLTKIDKSTKTTEFTEIWEYDFEEVKKNTLAYLKSVKLADFKDHTTDNLDIGITQSSKIRYNYKTTWISEAYFEATSSYISPDGSMKTHETSFIKIN